MVDSYRAGRQPGHLQPGHLSATRHLLLLCENSAGGEKTANKYRLYFEYISLNPHKAKQHYCSAFQSLSPYEPGVPLTYNLE